MTDVKPVRLNRRLAPALLLAALLIPGTAVMAADDAAGTASPTSDVEAAATATYTPHSWGEADAPVQILEFSSYTCGHCAAFHTDTLPTLRERYIDTGKVRLTLIDFPLDNVAGAVSLITHCAPDPIGTRMVDIFYGDQDAWLTRTPLESITGIARLAGLSPEAVSACLNNEPLYAAIMNRRAEAAETWGITGTPTFVIAGERHTGSYRLDDMTAAIDAALAEAGVGTDP